MSGLTQELITPTAEVYFEFPVEVIAEVVTDVYNVTKPKSFTFKSDDYNGNPAVWSTNIDAIIVRVKNIYDSI